MKAYKLTVVVIDLDECGDEGIKNEIENANYGNDCIMPHVTNIEEADIGEWSDDHPMNKKSTFADECHKHFPNI